MISLAWPWILIVLPLPLVVRRWIAAVAADQGQALRLPFYRELTDSGVSRAAQANRWRRSLAWLAWALRSSSQVRRVPVHGVAGVRLEFADGSQLVLERPEDEALAHLSIPGQPTRPVALAPRSTEDCLAEELRRLEDRPSKPHFAPRNTEPIE